MVQEFEFTLSPATQEDVTALYGVVEAWAQDHGKAVTKLAAEDVTDLHFTLAPATDAEAEALYDAIITWTDASSIFEVGGGVHPVAQ